MVSPKVRHPRLGQDEAAPANTEGVVRRVWVDQSGGQGDWSSVFSMRESAEFPT